MKANKYLFLLILTFPSCKSASKLAAERAQQERDLLRSLHGRYADSNYISFPITLPGGAVQLRLQANCPDFDSGTVKSESGQLIIAAPCPAVTINADSIIRNSAVYKALLAGRWQAELQRDSLMQQNAVLAASCDRFKAGRNAAYGWLIGIVLMALARVLAGGGLSVFSNLISKVTSTK